MSRGIIHVDGVRYTASAQTVADGGTINALASYVRVTCSDGGGCDLTISETGAPDGMVMTLVNTGTNELRFADTAGVQELDGAFTAAQYETLTVMYRTDRWVELSRSPGTGGGGGAPTTAQYVTLATDGTLSNERVLTGTSNQVAIMDNGAGSTVVLSTPQDLHSSATPQFGRIGLGVAADSSAVLKATGQYGSTLFDAGNSSTAITVNWNNGNTQLVTLTGNATFTLSNPKDGFRYLIVLKQDGTGSRTVTWPSAVKWPAGTAPTLSTAAGKCDIVTLVWVAGIGASGNYLAAANVDYTPA